MEKKQQTMKVLKIGPTQKKVNKNSKFHGTLIINARLGKIALSINAQLWDKKKKINIFRDVFRNYTKPLGSFLQGSVVLLGSTSHLSLLGLSAYTEDYVRCSGNLINLSAQGSQSARLSRSRCPGSGLQSP